MSDARRPPQFDTLSTSRALSQDNAFNQEQSDALTVALQRATEHLPTTSTLRELEHNLVERLLQQDVANADRIAGVTRWLSNILAALLVTLLATILNLVIPFALRYFGNTTP